MQLHRCWPKAQSCACSRSGQTHCRNTVGVQSQLPPAPKPLRKGREWWMDLTTTAEKPWHVSVHWHWSCQGLVTGHSQNLNHSLLAEGMMPRQTLHSFHGSYQCGISSFTSTNLFISITFIFSFTPWFHFNLFIHSYKCAELSRTLEHPCSLRQLWLEDGQVQRFFFPLL